MSCPDTCNYYQIHLTYRSDSSVSLEPASDLKPTRNIRLKQQRPTKTTPAKHSPNASKKETSSAGSKPTKIANDIEKHANKVANLGVSKSNETKLKAPTSNKINSNLQHHQSHHQPQQQQHTQHHHHQQQQLQQQQQQTQVAQVCPTQFDQHGRYRLSTQKSFTILFWIFIFTWC